MDGKRSTVQWLLAVAPLLILSFCSFAGEEHSSNVSFGDLLRYKGEVALSTPPALDLGMSGALAISASGIVVSSARDRVVAWFQKDGLLRLSILLPTPPIPTRIHPVRACLADSGHRLLIYDGSVNSLREYDARGTEVRFDRLDPWRIDRWGANGHHVIATGKDFSGRQRILAKSLRIEGESLVRDVTLDLLWPTLYGSLGWPNGLVVDEDGNFVLLEGASMRILSYSAEGSLLATSTELPEGFIAPAEALNPLPPDFTLIPHMIKNHTPSVSLARVGAYFLVSWVDLKEPKSYIEVFDLQLRLRLSRVEMPTDLAPILFAVDNSVFLARSPGSCPVRGHSNNTPPEATKELTIVEYELNRSAIER